MKKLVLLSLFSIAFNLYSDTTKICISQNLPIEFPRLLTQPNMEAEIKYSITNDEDARNRYLKIKEKVDVYADSVKIKPDWLYSRLQMYWKSHATDVYIRAEVFDHAGGEKAPVPTVRFSGARATTTNFARPALKDILPYMDDERGLFYHNKLKAGRPLEWVEASKTGRNIESVNREIAGIARDAAFIYWVSGDEFYAKLATDVFDTYMTGIYYRNIPVDLNNGHQQTLVGMTSFEVIHEDILFELIPLYDLLHNYLLQNKPDKMFVYSAALKKMADNIIANGVPHNNWNLFQSVFVLDIARVLDENSQYADGKGRTYYIDFILNQSGIRQWSLPKLIDYGFDKNTGIWSESPGYSINVVSDFANVSNWCGIYLKLDLAERLPIIPKALAATPQYLFPNMYVVGFGDTHSGHLRTDLFERMIANAQLFGKREQEIYFTRILKLFEPDYGKINQKKTNRENVSSFFANKELKLDSTIQAGKIYEYVTNTFWAPKVSWFVQRNGMEKRNSLMISLNGSEGNHQHANGISMELYGKGYVLAPDAGIGSGYFAPDYTEYYSQFPAHNTVCVDGVSSYPVMKSNHPFALRSCYPASGVKDGIYNSITYSDVYFREPESCSDQTRLNSIITTGEETGYYIDIFRSNKVHGNDKMHDYFYHNLGTVMSITDENDQPLPLQQTQELAFAGAHLYAYSYIYNQKVTQTTRNIKARFTIPDNNGDSISMNMWMKGENDRKIFSAYSPACEGISRLSGMPYNIKENPTLTFVARQYGEARLRPFVVVFEPSSNSEPSNIQSVSYFTDEYQKPTFAGIKVVSKNGREDLIFSNENDVDIIKYKTIKSQSTYSVVSKTGTDNSLFFMGNGKMLEASNIKIKTKNTGQVLLEQKNNKWYFSSTVDCTIIINNKQYKLGVSDYRLIK